MTILLDPGHGSDTPGKRSPDGRFREYAFNREITARVASKLTSLGLNAEIIVHELTDVPLKERANRVNARCAALGTGNAIRHQHSRKRRRKRLKMDERTRMELLHFQGRHCR